MSLTATEKKEIEVVVRKEIKDFFGSNTMQQYENKLIDVISKELKRGKLEGDVKEITLKMCNSDSELKSWKLILRLI